MFKCVQISFARLENIIRGTWTSCHTVLQIAYSLEPFVVFCTLIHCKISVNLQIDELEPGTATCDLFQGGPATSILRFDKPQLFTRDYFGCKP